MAAPPPPPPVVDLGSAPATDGLHRFVVGPLDSTAAALLTGDGAPAPALATGDAGLGTGGAASCADDTLATSNGGGSSGIGADPGGSKPAGTGANGPDPAGQSEDGRITFDSGQLGQVPPGASLAVERDVAGYRDAAGHFTRFDPAASSPTPGAAGTSPGPTGTDPAADCTPAGPASRADTDSSTDTDTRTDTDTPADPMAAALAGQDGVVSVEPIGDGRYAVAATTDDALADTGLPVAPDALLEFTADPYEGYQWTLDNSGHNLDRTDNPPPQTADADIDGREAAAARGTGVVVAVVDSGADLSHPDLAAAEWTNPGEVCGNHADDDGNGFVDDCHGWDFGNEDNTPYAAGNPDHATHVAGIIAAQPGNGIGMAGIAPGAKIMNLSVAGPGGMTVSSVARAVRYAVDNGADVVNMSLGTSPGTPAASVQPMFDAVAYAAAHGVLLVVAAGNSNVDLTSTAVYPASIPGPNMLVVGASAPDDTRAGFSNYGAPVDIFAPGVLIVSTLPNRSYGFMSGTSQASPTTAAVAASVIGRRPDLSPAQVIAQLVGTADQIGPLSAFVTNGVRLNAARSIGVQADTGSAAAVSISGLTTTNGHVEAQVALDEGPGFDQPYRWEATLVTLRATAGRTTPYGLVNLPVAIDGGPTTTDQRGSVTLSPGGTGAAALTTDLPAGAYGLVVEAVPTADPSMRLGQAFAATFEVGDGGGGGGTPDPGATTTTAAGGGGGATSSTTTGPSPTTAPPTSPGPTSSPTTRAPGASSTTAGPGGTTATTASRATTSTTSGGAATPTTRATTTTTNGGGATPTTRATITTTSGGGATPTTTATTTVAGQWAVFTISPRSGPIAYGTVVSIAGAFPESAYVWFGNQQGQVLYQSSSWILVTTPAVGTAGPVDVSLRTAGGGTVLTMPGAFTFSNPTATSGGSGTTTPATPATTAPPGTTSPTTARSTTTTTAGSGSGTSPTTRPAPATTAPATTAAPTTTPATVPSTTPATAVPGASVLSPRAVASGGTINLGGGLAGVAFTGWSSLGTVPACASDPCRTRQI